MKKIFNDFLVQPLWIKLTILFYSVCLLGATRNHILHLMEKGFLPYTKWFGAPFILNIFWTSLTLIDPLMIIVLFINTGLGIFLILIIMLIDVIINIYATYHLWNLTILRNSELLLQTAFAVFVLASGFFILKYKRNIR